MVDLNPVSSTILVGTFLLLSLGTFVVFLLLALGLNRLNTKLEELTARVDPLLAKTDQILTVTNDKITSLGDKAEGILAQGEEVAENVHHKVDRTATAVQRTIHAPIIGINSLAAGVTRGVETFGQLQRGRNGTSLPRRPSTLITDAFVTEETRHEKNGQGAAEPLPTLAGREKQ